MKVFGSEMLLITFVFAVLEVVMFVYQLTYYLSRPQDKQRLYYLILLLLLIVYNITGGLFPDPEIDIPIVAQNIIAYGSGFIMASYFPYYFYKGFGLVSLRLHAIYGVLLFLILPFLIFFVVVYSLNENLDFAIKYGIIIPFFYSIVLLWAIHRAIRLKYKHHKSRSNYMEMLAVYLAVIPWVSMTAIAYFNLGQFIEEILTNGGFVVITIIFISTSIKRARKDYAELQQLKTVGMHPSPYFEENSISYGLTQREIEIVQLIRQGLKNRIIAESLHISEGTVKKHVENLFHKTGAKGRVELIHKLFFTGRV